MFTGIVEEVGTVMHVAPQEGLRRIRIEVPAPFLKGVCPGDSVSVDGACLTPITIHGGHFDVELVTSTLSRTVAGGYAEGLRVNLEKALRLGDRLDGHLVQGHVDGIGRVVQLRDEGETRIARVRLPTEVHRSTIPRGSITLNGVSLTVSELLDDDLIEVTLIPHTRSHTNLGKLEVGTSVNVEGDLIGKYVGRLLPREKGSPERATGELDAL
ncbi:MAG: riboflavin synthase [Gemmatimonadota bacterium]